MYNLATGASRTAMMPVGGMRDFGPTGGNGFRFQGSPGMRDWTVDASGTPVYIDSNGYPVIGNGTPPVTVTGAVNGQPVTGTGHSLQTAWLGFANNALGSIMAYLNGKQNLQITQLRAGIAPDGQPLAGAAGAVNSITTWMSQNPLLVVAIGAGLLLYLAPSPRKGR